MAELPPKWDEEIELDKVVCRFYVNSFCEDGDKCHFPHVPKEGKILDTACRFFLRNKCHFGKLCALDHINIVDRNGKQMLKIIQQQLGARKRQMESLNLKVKVPSNKGHHANFIGEPFARVVMSAESEEAKINTTSPMQSADEKCLAIGSIKSIMNCGDWEIYDKGSKENNLQDFFKSTTLQTPAWSVSNSMKISGNAHRSLRGLTQSEFETVGNQMAIDVESKSKNYSNCEPLQIPVYNPYAHRSEEERRLTRNSGQLDSKCYDRIPSAVYATGNRSGAFCSSLLSQKATGGFDPNETMLLYNTLVVPRGRTAEEIALFGEFSFLPVDSNSRVPLYIRGATFSWFPSEYVSKQTTDDKKAEENNFLSQQQVTEERYVYTPSGRRVGLYHPYDLYSPNQDMI